MGCAGCSTGGATPAGCGSKGHCATGGCNMMNTYNWLADMPIAFGNEQNDLFEISFNNGTNKEFYRNGNKVAVNTGDLVVVETGMGFDIGRITLSGELVKLQMKKKRVKDSVSDIRNILRHPSDEDHERWKAAKEKEQETMIKARVIARKLELDMKIGQVEFQADGKKATFYYIADNRVDFRELIKEYAKEFKVKIEMRQIGARQEAGRIGGFGSCGRELCCSTWLTDFRSVSTNAARYQNLSINMSKLSGQCGRLKCCLNFELDTYMEALEEFPKRADKLLTEGGEAKLMKTDILQRLMWYVVEGSSTFYPVSVSDVKDIIAKNKKGEKGPALGLIAHQVEIEDEEEELEFADTVGHISLNALEKKNKKRRNKRKGKGGKDNNGGNQQQAKDNSQGGGQNKGGRNKGGGQKKQKPQQQGKGQQDQNKQANAKQGDGQQAKSGGNRSGNRNRSGRNRNNRNRGQNKGGGENNNGGNNDKKD